MNLRDELTKIRSQHGVLTPEAVVEAARPADSPLHRRFEWDDAAAAEGYRREQARHLICEARLVYVDRRGKDRDVRAFHAVRTDEGFAFEPSDEIAADPLLSAIVMRDMEREWKALRSKYADFKEFWQMVNADSDEAVA